MTFAAVALAKNLEYRANIRRRSDPGFLECFVQEVRRFYPFFPFVGGRTRHEFSWKGYRFRGNQWVLLDLYGTNHPELFGECPGTLIDEEMNIVLQVIIDRMLAMSHQTRKTKIEVALLHDPLNMDITLNQARAFCAVVDHRSYVAAAQSLNKSHSSLVYAIQCLEDQCGFDLLDRRQYRNTLTPNGKRIYEKCRTLLAAEAELKKLCRELDAGWEPSVRIVYDGILPTEPFVHILNSLRDQNVPTRAQIYSDYLHGVEKSFLELDAQIMVSVVSPQDPSGAYVSHALPPMKSLLVAHKDHPLNTRTEPWDIEELKAFTFLTVRGTDQSLNPQIIYKKDSVRGRATEMILDRLSEWRH